MSADKKIVETDKDLFCQGAVAHSICVNRGISEEIKSIVAPLRSRGAELDSWRLEPATAAVL